MVPAASPRLVSAESSRGARGVAATRLRGIFTWHPRRRRDAASRFSDGGPAQAIALAQFELRGLGKTWLVCGLHAACCAALGQCCSLWLGPRGRRAAAWAGPALAGVSAGYVVAPDRLPTALAVLGRLLPTGPALRGVVAARFAGASKRLADYPGAPTTARWAEARVGGAGGDVRALVLSFVAARALAVAGLAAG